MRVLIHVVFTIFFTNNAYSSWYCNQVASEWVEHGKTLSACGVGYGKDENEARINAFENAKKEFNNVCGKETSCAGRMVNIDPQKSDCGGKEDGFTCRRLFYFHITDQYATPEEAPIVVAPAEPKIIKEKTEINNIHNEYTIINQPTKIIPRGMAGGNYKQYVRSVGNVQIYETNNRDNHVPGAYLKNPSETDLNHAIKRASRSGAMNRIYIIRD